MISQVLMKGFKDPQDQTLYVILPLLFCFFLHHLCHFFQIERLTDLTECSIHKLHDRMSFGTDGSLIQLIGSCRGMILILHMLTILAAPIVPAEIKNELVAMRTGMC